MKKRILGLLLAICLIIGLLPITAFASSGKLRLFYPTSDSGSTSQIDISEGGADVYLTVVNNMLKPTDGVVPEDNYLKISHPAGGVPTVTLKNLRYAFQRGIMFGWKSSINASTASSLNVPYTVILEGDNVINPNYKAGPMLNFNSSGTVTIQGTGTLSGKAILAESNSVTNAGFITSNGDIVIEKGVTLTMEYNAFNGANAISTLKNKGNITVNGATINIKGVDGKNAMGSAFYAAGNLTIQNGSTININGNPLNNNLFDVAGNVTINDSTVIANITADEETTGKVFANAPVIGEGLEAVASTEVITDPAQATPYDAANAASLKYFKVAPKQATPPEANFDQTQLVLKDDITVNFRADKATVVAAGGTQVKTQIGDNAAEYITLTDAMLSGDYYVVPFTGVAAKQMGETVSMTICDAEGNPVGQTKTDSVRAYALRMLENKPAGHTDEQYAALKVLLADMLNYGAMAQDMFDYDEDNMVTDGLTLQGTEEMKPVEAKAAATDAEGYLGTAFVLNNNIAMAMALDASVIDKTCTAKVTYKNYLGDDVVAEGIVADATSTDNNTVFIFNDLVAADGRCEVTWEFYEGETLKLTVTDSMEAYVGRMIGEYPELAELMKYSDAAETYFLLMR